MKISVKIPALLLSGAIAISRASPPPSRAWSQGDPSPEEQATMEWLNQARRDPVATLDSLLGEAPTDPLIAAFLAGESPETAGELEANLSTAVALAQSNAAAFPNSSAISSAPLAFYPLFQSQAAALAAQSPPPPFLSPAQRPPPDYLYPTPIAPSLLTGLETPVSGPNATGGEAEFGGTPAAVAELLQANLYEPYLTGREFVLSLLASPGTGSPPPAFLSQGDSLPDLALGHIRMAGISLAPRADGGQSLALFEGNSEFFSQSDLPFGDAGTVFITGVVYQDNNGNGFYDAGEGIAGVTILPDHGDWYAVTGSAGGYAIPVPANSGPYVVTASGGPLQDATLSVQVGADSVKADWVLPPPPPSLPPQVEVPPAAGGCQIVGMSTRGLVQPGAAALIGGFVIAGPSGASKRLLIRGVGPSLGTVGVPADECVPATSLQILSGSAALATNTGWTTSPDGGAAVARAAASVGDFPLLDWAGGGGDSALVLSLPPGDYDAVVTPATGAPPIDLTGRIGLVEIYDLTPGDGSRLVNLSTRGEVGPGDAGLYLGCTVAGAGQERLLFRGVGPALQGFGVSAALPNPTLSLLDSSGNVLAENDDWSLSAQTNQIRSLAASAGAFPLPEGGTDAALLADLAPANYSAVIGAKAGSLPTGLALIEVYEAP